MITVLEAIASGNPPLRGSQQYGAQFMEQVTSLSDRIRSRVSRIYDQSGIDFRYSCISDYLREPEEFDFFPPDWSLQPAPSTSDRNRQYRRHALPLAEKVAREVMQKADLAAADVTHVITVSCTGFYAPGLDIELSKNLGLRRDVKRTMIGFMGCYAAFNGLRVADAFCRSTPGARVLLVCVELCTIHFQVADSMENAVINAIFSDGAAAAVLSSRGAGEAKGELAYAGALSRLDDDSMEYMTWDIGDSGFQMGLSAKVPDVLARHLPSYIDELAGGSGLRPSDLGFWAIHPGGRLIIDRAREVLQLSPEDLYHSSEVLRLHGNMSSPTILFVMERILEDRKITGNATAGVALSFGPGLTIEGCLFRRF